MTGEQAATFFACVAGVHIFMDMFYWPTMGVSEEDLEKILPGPGLMWKEVINIAAAAAACDFILHQLKPCFGKQEMLEAMRRARAAANRFRKNPEEALRQLRSLPPNLRRLLGLGEDGGRESGTPGPGGKKKPEEPPWYLRPFIRL